MLDHTCRHLQRFCEHYFGRHFQVLGVEMNRRHVRFSVVLSHPTTVDDMMRVEFDLAYAFEDTKTRYVPPVSAFVHPTSDRTVDIFVGHPVELRQARALIENGKVTVE